MSSQTPPDPHPPSTQGEQTAAPHLPGARAGAIRTALAPARTRHPAPARPGPATRSSPENPRAPAGRTPAARGHPKTSTGTTATHPVNGCLGRQLGRFPGRPRM